MAPDPLRRAAPSKKPSTPPGFKATLSQHKPAAKPTAAAAQPHPHAVPPAPSVAGPKEAPVAVARATLLEALYKEVGQPGSLLQHPHGQSFVLRPDVREGAVHTHRTLMVPLPKNGSVPHTADVAVELEDGAAVFVDVLDSNARLEDLKADAFDATLLKTKSRAPHFSVLVYVRLPHPVHSQDLVEAVAHSYDYVFGIDETNVSLAVKFAACTSEIVRRIRSGAA